VSTFIFNTVYGLPLKINDPSAEVSLVYIGDVVAEFRAVMEGAIDRPVKEYLSVNPIYKATVGELADVIGKFTDFNAYCRDFTIDPELTAKLYKTYNL